MATVTYLLLVTWFSMTGTSSYQVEFDSRELCEQASSVVLQEEAKLKQRFAQTFMGGAMPDMGSMPGMEGMQGMQAMQGMAQMMGPMMMGMMQPYVSAVCVER